MYKKKSMARLAVAAGLGLTLAFGGIAAVPTPAQAADVTITEAGNQVGYKFYRLLGGTYTDSTGAVGDVLLNPTLVDSTKTQLLQLTGVSATSPTAANEVLAKLGDSSAPTAAQIATALASATPTKTATSGNNNSLTVSGLEEGYYLVAVDPTTTTGKFESVPAAMLVNVADGKGTITIKTKKSTPTLEKEIKDDTADGTSWWDKNWSDLADAGLIEGQPSQPTYRLTGTVASDIATYTTGYYYQFQDIMPTGFDLANETELGVESIKVYKGASDTTGTDIKSAFKVNITTDNATHTSTVTWTDNDLRKTLLDKGFTTDNLATAIIKIVYSPKYDNDDLNRIYKNLSTLDKSSAQVNKAKIEFSNNPTNKDDHGTTPEHETYLYSFNLVVNKVDNEGNPLTGAAFTLTDKNGKTVGKEISADVNGKFTFTGLDSDTVYTITETKVPAGYKPIDPIKFQIKVTKGTDGKIASIKVVDESGNDITDNTIEATGATVDARVVNIKQPNIPETGAAGIAGGVVIGGMLIAVSAVQIVKNRKQDAQA